ncbi:MAG: iron-sulfur cluster assembly scaffold protein [Desulfobacteraceae bacterium]|nr:iron-sulfur cluster assembly scaffold protein [Desulfobacteraceae bacterium]
MSDIPQDFLKSHSLKFLESAFRTDRQERIEKADGYGKNTGDCGDTIEFYVMMDGARISNLSYFVNGCINTNACANAIVDLVQGRRLEQAWELKPENVAEYLESLPQDHFHCAELAVGALYKALADTRQLQRQSWKKLYR